MTIEFHPGVLPNDPSKPRLKIGRFLTTVPTEHPASLDYLSRVKNYPMYLNDNIGDCTCAGAGHIIQAESTYGQGSTQTVSDNDVLKAYEAVSGYDPKTGDNDNGAVLQDVLNYWRKTGIGGHQILAFAELDTKNMDEVKSAMNTFGAIYVGFNFPDSAMDQFNNGQPWDVVRGATIEGGHAVHGGAYLENGILKFVTWGAVQEMTQAFWDKYVFEAWIVITPEWLAANGKSPTGLDLYALGEALADITGGANPFPAPTPAPTPEPTPSPTPTPDDSDETLAAWLTEWFQKGHTLPHHSHLEAVLRTWLDQRNKM